VADLVGRDVVVGLRPHQLSLNPPYPGAPKIVVRPVAVESLGHEVNVLFVPPFATVTASSPGSADAGSAEAADLWTAQLDADAATTARVGVPAEVFLDLRDAHFFDVESTRSLAVDTDHSGRPMAAAAA
jgi:hypothetical protein